MATERLLGLPLSYSGGVDLFREGVSMKGLAKLAVLAMTLGVSGTMLAQLAPGAPKPPAHPYTRQHIYSETADPRADIAAALKQAKAEHKRVILDFGGDWCGDCQVLDIYFHEQPNLEVLQKHFILVHVYIGRMDLNLDLAQQYGVPIKNGVPALAVLSANGKVLYSQATGEFRDMRYMDSQSVSEFLNRWKG